MKTEPTISRIREMIQMKCLFHHILLEEESLTAVLDLSMANAWEQETHLKVDAWVDVKRLLEDCYVEAACIEKNRCVVEFHYTIEWLSQIEILIFWNCWCLRFCREGNDLILMDMIFCCRFFPSGFFLP